MYITGLLGDKAIFKKDETCLIMDELQECPNARTSLKFFKTDGRYDVICTGSLLGYKGAIFENLVADFLNKMGRKLYYFHKDSGLEIDFIIRYKGECTLLECKLTNGNTKSSKTVLKNYDKYHVNNLIKLGDYNIGRNDNITTLPLYLGFLIREL